MQAFPILSESQFKKTRSQVHSVAKVIGRFREMLVKPIAKNDNLWLTVVPEGFCTPPIQEQKELEIGFDIGKHLLEIADNRGKYASVSVQGMNQRELGAELVSLLNTEFEVNTVVKADVFEHGEAISLNPDEAADFNVQFNNYSKLLRGFWGTLKEGVKTQICLWPHHFDNAFKWFSGRTIGDEQEQMGIGVSNGDENYELPYIYMTFWPELRKTNTLDIPEGAVLHDYQWSGLILPYEAVMEKKNSDEQKELIENFFTKSFAAVQRAFSKR